MKLIEMKVIEFINEVDSKAVTPGGGSVSALASSLGIALTRMVGHLSVGKKKFRALDEEIQNKFKSIIESFEAMKIEMIDLIDKDTEAFNLIMAAFKLPKETDEDKKRRSLKIEEGTLEAIKVPYRVAELSLEAMINLDYILKYGNRNTLSDLGVSALLLKAGLEGAILNVKINIPGISNEEIRNHYLTKSQEILNQASRIKKVILDVVHNKL